MFMKIEFETCNSTLVPLVGATPIWNPSESCTVQRPEMWALLPWCGSRVMCASFSAEQLSPCGKSGCSLVLTGWLESTASNGLKLRHQAREEALAHRWKLSYPLWTLWSWAQAVSTTNQLSLLSGKPTSLMTIRHKCNLLFWCLVLLQLVPPLAVSSLSFLFT